jgi:hypothetical protein
MTVAEVWQRLQAQAEFEHGQSVAQLTEHRAELERVLSFFGPRQAMEFAWSEFEVSCLAFLVEFELMEQGEALGVFAL